MPSLRELLDDGASISDVGYGRPILYCSSYVGWGAPGMGEYSDKLILIAQFQIDDQIAKLELDNQGFISNGIIESLKGDAYYRSQPDLASAFDGSQKKTFFYRTKDNEVAVSHCFIISNEHSDIAFELDEILGSVVFNFISSFGSGRPRSCIGNGIAAPYSIGKNGFPEIPSKNYYEEDGLLLDRCIDEITDHKSHLDERLELRASQLRTSIFDDSGMVEGWSDSLMERIPNFPLHKYCWAFGGISNPGATKFTLVHRSGRPSSDFTKRFIAVITPEKALVDRDCINAMDLISRSKAGLNSWSVIPNKNFPINLLPIRERAVYSRWVSEMRDGNKRVGVMPYAPSSDQSMIERYGRSS